MPEIHEGGCVCGNVRYRTTGAALLATACHCKFCQRRTGSAFSEPAFFKIEQVQLSGGEMATYEHRSDESGRWLRMEFCPRCATTVTWTAQRRPGVRGISSGTFDDPDWLKFQRHIWTRSAQPWVTIPAHAQCFERGAPV